MINESIWRLGNAYDGAYSFINNLAQKTDEAYKTTLAVDIVAAVTSFGCVLAAPYIANTIPYLSTMNLGIDLSIAIGASSVIMYEHGVSIQGLFLGYELGFGMAGIMIYYHTIYDYFIGLEGNNKSLKYAWILGKSALGGVLGYTATTFFDYTESWKVLDYTLNVMLLGNVVGFVYGVVNDNLPVILHTANSIQPYVATNHILFSTFTGSIIAGATFAAALEYIVYGESDATIESAILYGSGLGFVGVTSIMYSLEAVWQAKDFEEINATTKYAWILAKSVVGGTIGYAIRGTAKMEEYCGDDLACNIEVGAVAGGIKYAITLGTPIGAFCGALNAMGYEAIRADVTYNAENLYLYAVLSTVFQIESIDTFLIGAKSFGLKDILKSSILNLSVTVMTTFSTFYFLDGRSPIELNYTNLEGAGGPVYKVATMTINHFFYENGNYEIVGKEYIYECHFSEEECMDLQYVEDEIIKDEL
jgi:hypothetical protein